MYDSKPQIPLDWNKPLTRSKTHKESENEQEESKKRQHNYNHFETEEKTTHWKPQWANQRRVTETEREVDSHQFTADFKDP